MKVVMKIFFMMLFILHALGLLIWEGLMLARMTMEQFRGLFSG